MTDLVFQVMDGPFEWGRKDCCTSACDVFMELHGIDPMAPLRGLYRTERQASRLIRRWGGWPAMTEALARGAKLSVSGWAPGALGLAVVENRMSLVIGFENGLWAGKAVNGLATTDQVVEAWVR